MDSVEFKVTNAADLIAQLRAFQEDVAVRTVRGSTRRIADYLQTRLETNTPTFTGRLRSNFKVLARYVRRRSVVSARVVVNTIGKAGNIRNAFYWRFVEFGHKTRPSKSGRNRQREVPGQRFAERTIASAAPQVTQMFYDDLQKAIDRAKRRS